MVLFWLSSVELHHCVPFLIQILKMFLELLAIFLILTIVNSNYSISSVTCLWILFSKQSSGLNSDLFPGAFPPSYSYLGHFFLGLSSCHLLLDPPVPIISELGFLPYFTEKQHLIFFREKTYKRQNI